MGACHKAHDDDLEKEPAPEKEDENPVATHVDESKPYPDKNLHWSVPKDKKVKKWCSTKFGAVPCTMLKEAQEAGLLAHSDAMETNMFLDETGTGASNLDDSPDLVDVIGFEDE